MSLETRIERLEHREAIKELRAQYCYAIDAREWDEFTALFTDDAELDFGPIGTFNGRPAVRRFAEDIVGEEHPFLVHMVHNPILELHEKDASGTWYFEVPCTFSDGTAGWIQGRYDDEYKLVEGEWYFDCIMAEFNYFAPYGEGWADIVSERHRH